MVMQVISRLALIWRGLFLSIMYPLFALGCVLIFILIPITQILHKDKVQQQKYLRYLVHVVAKNWLRIAWFFNVLGYKFESEFNSKKLDGRPVVVISNHPTLIDVIIIWALVPDLCCVLKSDLNRFSLLAILVDKLGYISNNDPELMLKMGAEKLKKHQNLLIFPEGTRTVPGVPVDFKLGAAELVLRAQADILPIIIHYSGRHLSKSCPWYEFPSEKLRYSIEIGPSINLASEFSKNEQDRKSLQKRRRTLNLNLQNYYQNRLKNGVGMVASVASSFWMMDN